MDSFSNVNGLPVITSALTITGQGAETTIIERHASAPQFRILEVAAAGIVTIQRLTLRNGLLSSWLGGGTANIGTLTLTDCILTRNHAEAGGGLFNDAGTVTITHTTFDGNRADHPGGGLFNDGGTVTIANSTFVHNNADGPGGIANDSLTEPSIPTMTLTNTTVANNNGGITGIGGVGNTGFAVLQSTTIADNHGGVAGGPGALLTPAPCSCRTASSPAMTPRPCCSVFLPIAPAPA